MDGGPDLSNLDLLIIQIDGIHIDEDLMLLAAVGIDRQRRGSIPSA